MPDYSRRTHIVRISDAKPGEPPSDTYVDIEVIDAISFKVENGKEVVLNMAVANSRPLIIDETGGGHEKTPGDPTQRTHMKRITNKDDPTQQLDIEVMDVVAFRDANGHEWILDMKATTGAGPDIWDTTDSSGSNSATRRVHEEVISSPFGKAKKDAGKDYLTSQRVDAISFRTIMGKEVVLKCASNDDPNSSDPRASTYIVSPKGYDPNNDDGPTPPPNKDAHNYVAFVKDASGFFTGDEKIQMGPFWWIRKISSSPYFLRIDLSATNYVSGDPTPPPAPTYTIDVGDLKDGKPHVKLIDQTAPVVTRTSNKGTQANLYFVWPDFLPLPTLSNYSNINPVSNYAGQFSTFVYIDDLDGIPRPNLNGNGAGAAGGGDLTTGMGFDPSNGGFQTLAEAQWYAHIFNEEYAGIDPTTGAQIGPAHFWKAYYDEFGNYVTVPRGTIAATVSAQSLPINFGASGITALTQSLLFKIPTKEAIFKIKFSGTLQQGSNSVFGWGYSDAKKAIKVVGDTAIPSSFYGGGSSTFTPPDGAIPDPAMGADVVEAAAGVDTTYTVTTEVIANPDTTSIKKHHVSLNIVNDAHKGGVQ